MSRRSTLPAEMNGKEQKDPARLASGRSLLLNDYEPLGGSRVWWWEDLDSNEVSQEFDSEESAIVHMREERLLWSRLSDLGD